MPIKLSCSSFEQGTMIPKKYTCDGLNVSPPLEWEGMPLTTKTLAIIVEDPDAPVKVWVHWLIFNINPHKNKLHEEISKAEIIEMGSKQGKNDFGKIGYGGPCPPNGIHRYFFNIYALDNELNLAEGITRTELLKAMQGHILGQGQLMGKYAR